MHPGYVKHFTIWNKCISPIGNEACHSVARRWSSCTRCGLHRTRRHVVIGRHGSVGLGRIRILFIGEAPGETEDLEGLPFVGRSGVIFQSLLNFSSRLCSFNYIVTNTVCCRPQNLKLDPVGPLQDFVYQGSPPPTNGYPHPFGPCSLPEMKLDGDRVPFVTCRADLLRLDPSTYTISDLNREPTIQEMRACLPHIDEFVEEYQPHAIVYLGEVAEFYKTKLPNLHLSHPAYIVRKEYKLLPVKKQAVLLGDFVKSLSV